MRYLVTEYVGVDGRPSVCEIQELNVSDILFEDSAEAHRGFLSVQHGPFDSLDACRQRCHQLGYELEAVSMPWAIERWMASYFVEDQAVRAVH